MGIFRRLELENREVITEGRTIVSYTFSSCIQHQSPVKQPPHASLCSLITSDIFDATQIAKKVQATCWLGGLFSTPSANLQALPAYRLRGICVSSLCRGACGGWSKQICVESLLATTSTACNAVNPNRGLLLLQIKGSNVIILACGYYQGWERNRGKSWNHN